MAGVAKRIGKPAERKKQQRAEHADGDNLPRRDNQRRRVGGCGLEHPSCFPVSTPGKRTVQRQWNEQDDEGKPEVRRAASCGQRIYVERWRRAHSMLQVDYAE